VEKCRKCREGKKHNMESTPTRPPRGSIRKAKRDAMRAQKKQRMKAAAEG
jgi:hypothetical protein